MSNINPETGEAIMGRSPRFTLWTAFLVFSTVTLGASVEVKNDQDPVTADAKWAVACSAITFSLTALMVLFQLSPVYAGFVTNNKLEGVVCIVLVAFLEWYCQHRKQCQQQPGRPAFYQQRVQQHCTEWQFVLLFLGRFCDVYFPFRVLFAERFWRRFGWICYQSVAAIGTLERHVGLCFGGDGSELQYFTN